MKHPGRSTAKQKHPLQPKAKAAGISFSLAVLTAIGAFIWELPLYGQTALGEPEEAIIHYEDSSKLTDPVSRLKDRIIRGKSRLQYTAPHGFLASLLEELGISSDSQCLAFSKTSSQNSHICPATPRAVYFNDQVYVGWVPQGERIDLVSVDAIQGCIFHTLDQAETAKPRLERQSDCIRCHLGPKTSRVPGVLVRSVLTDPSGYPRSQIVDFVSGHNSPLDRRWGGWYVTGRLENDTHLGNFFLPDRNPLESMGPSSYRDVTDLTEYFDVAPYLTRGSDVVALMVLEHQVRMQNLLIRLNYDARLAQGTARERDVIGEDGKPYALAAEALLEYLFFRNETPLKGKVRGTSTFAARFQALGPRDRKGRSLRDFDLVHRIFRYPCSYLIYSPSFGGLPSDVRTHLWNRMETILGGRDSTPCYANLTPEDRQAIREILEDTQPAFKAWQELKERAGDIRSGRPGHLSQDTPK